VHNNPFGDDDHLNNNGGDGAVVDIDLGQNNDYNNENHNIYQA
jgi:hypothetical protein